MTTQLRRWCESRRHNGSARFNAETSATLTRTLRLVREHLAMDLAWLWHRNGAVRMLQPVDGDTAPFRLAEGASPPVMDAFCERVLSGELPAVAGDTLVLDPHLAERLGVRSYAAVPVPGAGEVPYGLLGCVSGRANDSLRRRDADTMRLFAEMQAETITAYRARHAIEEAFLRNAEAMLAAGGPGVALQPILDVANRRTVAVEALARFPTDAYTTEGWFEAARRAGCGLELELDAISAALDLLPLVPVPQRLSVNGSPDLVASRALTDLLADRPMDRLIIEITEHNLAESISAVIDRVRMLQERGTWIAIDDAGTGYSSLHQILQLGPDIIKLDRTLVTGVDTDPMKRAMASAFVTFTSQAKTGLVAEGVETEAELHTLEEIGVPFAQGYYLARPRLVRSGTMVSV